MTKNQIEAKKRKTFNNRKPSYVSRKHDRTALVLQGGGALGAYQAGVYEELLTTKYQPDWVAGVSIGAINAALIAGNPPARRIERLFEFWHLVSSGMGSLTEHLLCPKWLDGPSGQTRNMLNQVSALCSTMWGVPGFYRPPIIPAPFQPDGSQEALGIYSTAPLKKSLERLIDFDLINSKTIRLSLGAVNVSTGNSEYFDNFEQKIGAEHVMASGALPPAFAPVIIDGQSYWDGGIVSNTPLQYVIDKRRKDSLLIFQVDLFSARGNVPTNLSEVQKRTKDLIYSSRTRYNGDMAAQVINNSKEVRDVLMTLPPRIKNNARIKRLIEAMRSPPTDIVQLIYRQKPYELQSNDYEFSRTSVLEHWDAGRLELRKTLAHPEWLEGRGLEDGVTQYDYAQLPHSSLTKHGKARGTTL